MRGTHTIFGARANPGRSPKWRALFCPYGESRRGVWLRYYPGPPTPRLRRDALAHTRAGGGARAPRWVVPLSARHISMARRAFHAPRDVRSFPDAGLQDFEEATRFPYFDPVQSLRVATQLAGPDRTLGPPCIPGSVCRIVRPILDLAVCIPSEHSHRTPLSHFKGSELFETLPCESRRQYRAPCAV